MKTKLNVRIALVAIVALMSFRSNAQTKIVYVQLTDTLVTDAQYRDAIVRKIGPACDANFYGVSDCLDNRAQGSGLAQLLVLFHTINPNAKAVCVMAQKTDKSFSSLLEALRAYKISHSDKQLFDSYNLELEVWNEKNNISWDSYCSRLRLIKNTFGTVEVYWGKYTMQAHFDTLTKYCSRILLSYYFDCTGITTLASYAAKCKSLDNGRLEAIRSRVPVIAIFNTKPEFCGAFISTKGIANCYNQLAKILPGRFAGYANYIVKT